MIFNTSTPVEIIKLETYKDFLINQGCIVELKKKLKKRTIKQNSYLHKLFSLFGVKFGYSIDEAKVLIKRTLKYTYKKNNQVFLKKTSKMDTKELTIFIEKFRNYSSINGYYLPSADEYLTNYAEFERQIADNEIYL